MRTEPLRIGTGLVAELQRSHRALIMTMSFMLLLNLVSSAYLLLVSQPQVAGYTELARESRLSHEAMLDQETGVRGWLATGNRIFLQPYDDGRRAGDTASFLLIQRSADDPDVAAQVAQMTQSASAWKSWADRAVAIDSGQPGVGTVGLSQLLLEGKSLFDSYRTDETRATDRIIGDRDRALRGEQVALVALPVTFVGATALAGLRARRRHRRLARTILEPIDRVLATIGALRSGDLSARTAATGVVELDSVGSALAALADDVSSANDLAAARANRLELLAARLAMVVQVAREVSGSLSIRYVSEAVTSAAAELLGGPATLWLRTQDGQLRVVRQSDDPHGKLTTTDVDPPELVAASASDARPLADATARTYPLILAGVVVGVLHVAVPTADEGTDEVLEALLSTAAAALESARLNSAAHERADVDPLTQLPNRWRMDADLAAEWERCRRYDRPLSFVMIDLDHFKELNDRYGHPLGDATLRAAAAAIKGGLRATDTAYRYGGEEFAVLLRETGLEAAAALAERLRADVAATSVAGSDLAVSASFGVADKVVGMVVATDLVTAADAALYTAKRSGRNRVVASDG